MEITSVGKHIKTHFLLVTFLLLCTFVGQRSAFWVAPLWGHNQADQADGFARIPSGGYGYPAGADVRATLLRNSHTEGASRISGDNAVHYPAWANQVKESETDLDSGAPDKRHRQRALWSLLVQCKPGHRGCDLHG